jgi:flagellar basal-body rod protein FlgF
MASGIWTAVSGATAQSAAVDAVANNLANVDTPAFKKDLPTFKEYITTLERNQAPKEIIRGPIKETDFYPDEGRDTSHVINDATHTDFTQGSLKVTQSPLDLAISGPGFLEVATPKGVRLTRQGSLKIAVDGKLVTPEGYPVLSNSGGTGPAILTMNARTPGRQPAGALTASADNQAQNSPELNARLISLRDRSGPLSITEQGEIFAGEDLVAKLSIVEFNDTKERGRVRKVGGGLFEIPGGVDPAALNTTPQSRIKQGMIETSNVNPVQEMTQLIRANRMFEHDLKAIKTYGEMMAKETNELGKF